MMAEKGKRLKEGSVKIQKINEFQYYLPLPINIVRALKLAKGEIIHFKGLKEIDCKTFYLALEREKELEKKGGKNNDTNNEKNKHNG